jgi:hypothetical protein
MKFIIQSLNVIRNTKKTYCGGDSVKTAHELYMKKDDPKDATLRFVLNSFSIEKNNRRTREEHCMGFGKPALISLLKGKKLRVHINATFLSAPDSFYQVLIFSIQVRLNCIRNRILYEIAF